MNRLLLAAVVPLLAVCAVAAANGPGWDELVAAVNKKDYARAQELVKATPALAKARNDDGWTALHAAAKEPETGSDARLALMTALLDAGAPLEARVEKERGDAKIFRGCTPLNFAASGDSYEAARLLILRGADANAACASGKTALHSAAFYGNKPLAELLLKKGAHVDARDQDGRTPLHEATQSGKDDLAAFLLRHGADVDARDSHGVTPLHLAAVHETPQTARLLVDFHASVNARDADGKTPLAWADPPPDEAADEMFGPAPARPEVVAYLRAQGGAK